MHEIALDLLILLAGIWLVAVLLRPVGLPTVMGELIVGVLVGPAVLGWIEPGEAIKLLAEIGIFFLMFHAGVETQPGEFYDALKRSLGVAVVGAIVPFTVSFGIATWFGLDWVGATFVGLTMTATAVVITLKSLKDLGLANTRVARIIIASCVIDDLLTLVFFGLIVGVLSGGSFEPIGILITLGKVVLFFAVSLVMGKLVYPRLTLPFRSEGGKGFTFVLVSAIGAGLFAEAIGLHMILGAYMAGLFFEEKVAHPNLVRIVNDRAYGIAYSFLGPIFFISLGFSITFDISAAAVVFIVGLTLAVIVGQIASAGSMALRMGMPLREALTVGVGMCGRAEMAFILASLALAQGAIDQPIFTILVFTAFLLNLFTPLALKGCAVLLEGRAAHVADATRGVLQIDKFNDPLVGVDSADPRGRGSELARALPDVRDGVVVFGHGPEVTGLLGELESRDIPTVLIEDREAEARRLHESGRRVVYARVEDEDLDLRPLAGARALVVNGRDELNALIATGAREQGFSGPIVALIDNPTRRSPMLLAGATAAFNPTHVLAAVIAVRASARIGPRVAGVEPWDDWLEVAELRVNDTSPLLHKTLAEAHIQGSIGGRIGAHIVGRWSEDRLEPPPAPDEALAPGMILVAIGSRDGIRRLEDLAHPIAAEGPIVVAGFGDVGQKLVQILSDAGEEVCVVDAREAAGVDVVGDVFDPLVLERARVNQSRVIILVSETDSDHAPNVPIISCVSVVEHAEQVYRAGADFVLSLSQVSEQILAHHILGETVSHQPRIKLVKLQAGSLAGRTSREADIRTRTRCSVVAVEREGEVLMEIAPTFSFNTGDGIFVCGTPKALNRFYEEFPATTG